ncbi:helix-turn-helix domain-containing protein [Streptomyces sp. NRRL F-5193]|uniref:helix-turn-helix domain-containing protein n=1 Tax=Streptomyces sp. NRRL F-5193 TaxID=1463860 RepID=UPI0005BE3A9D|nr:helix-turn-helix transcriptional regulator [Streptomyces sp. NRRL F-5193]
MAQRPVPLDETHSARAWWGKELRNWRRVRHLSSKALGELVQLSATYVERIEKNERRCTAQLAARFDAALDAGGALTRLWRHVEREEQRQRAHADKGAALPLTGGMEDWPSGRVGGIPITYLEGMSAVDRRKLMTLLGGLGVAATALPTRPVRPRQVRAEDIQQVRAASTTLSQWDAKFGGDGLVQSAAEGEMAKARALLELSCPPSLRQTLFTDVGRLAIVLGAAAFDRLQHDEAAELLELGRQCAEEADNWSLRASALNWSARQEIWRGRPEKGLTLAEVGLVRSDRLTPREQASLHNARARALAKMRQAKEARAAIGRSDDIVAQAKSLGEEAPWMRFYDHAQHLGDTGHALFDVAMFGGDRADVELARHRLEDAVDGHTPEFARSRALSATKVATLLMSTGEPDRAVAVATKALDEVGRLCSRRAAADVASLAQAAAPFSRRPELAELRARIGTVLA